MKKRGLFVAQMLVLTLLSGCAAPAPDPGSNPVSELVDLIPWAKSVAADASAQELTARIAEITARLSALDVSEAQRTELKARLTSLGEAIAAYPADVAAHVAVLNAILEDIRAAS